MFRIIPSRFSLLLFILVWSVFLIGCSNGQKPDKNGDHLSPSLEATLPGVWEHYEMSLRVEGVRLSDSVYTLEIKQDEWEQKLKVDRVETEYLEDHTYRMNFYLDSNKLDRTVRGMWNTFGDTTLMHIEPDGTYEYRVERAGDKWVLESIMDWDKDTQIDDYYRLVIGPPKKQKKRGLLRK